jgi:RNA polymerase sigma factor (sigma-70 family)
VSRLGEATISSLLHKVRICSLSGTSDEELLTRFAQEGHDLSFEVLVRRHGPCVFQVCHRLLSTYQDAEDAFQATFLVLARKAGTLTQITDLRRWLIGVAYRVTKKTQARRARRREEGGPAQEAALAALLDPDPSVAPDYRLRLRELARLLDQALGSLPPPLREAFVLCHELGYTREEAATTLGCSLATLQRRLRRARELMRQRLDARTLPEVIPPCTLLTAWEITRPDVPEALIARTLQETSALKDATLAHGPAAHLLQLADSAVRHKGSGLLRAVAALACLATLGTGVVYHVANGNQTVMVVEDQEPVERARVERTPLPDERTAPASASKRAVTPAVPEIAENPDGPDLPEDPEQLLKEVIAPRVLASLQGLGGTVWPGDVRLDHETETAHVLADWHLPPFEPAQVEMRYHIPEDRWEFWTDLYNGDFRSINPQKPIILVRAFGFEYSLKLPVLQEMESTFRLLRRGNAPPEP